MQVPSEIARDLRVRAFVLPHMCWQNGRRVQAVIARSEATKQSSFLVAAKLDCFASLAMTELTKCHGLRQGSCRRPRWNTSPSP